MELKEEVFWLMLKKLDAECKKDTSSERVAEIASSG